MCAPRFCACSSSSMINAAAPSPMTKPSRILSNGRQASAGSPVHRLIVLMKCECAERERGQRRFGSAGDDDIREIVANVTQRFADRDRSARATVRVRRADAAKAKLDRDVGMRRAAENLQRECLDSRRACLSSKNARADLPPWQTPPSAVPKLTPMRCCGFSARILDTGIVERELRRGDCRTARNDRVASVDAAEKILPAPNRESRRRNVH